MGAHNQDRRGKLEDQPFSFRQTKQGLVFIYWGNTLAATLKGNQAQAFLAQVQEADKQEAQLLMASLTGNFKRGNERNR